MKLLIPEVLHLNKYEKDFCITHKRRLKDTGFKIVWLSDVRELVLTDVPDGMQWTPLTNQFNKILPHYEDYA